MDRTAPDIAASGLAFLSGGGEMGALLRAKDWSSTPLGPVDSWSPALKTVVRLLLVNRFPQLLWWGPEYISIYNDPYRPVLGAKHPWALGHSVRDCWSEIWHILQPLIDTPFNGGPATWDDDILLEIDRNGFVEEAHFTIAYSPVPDDTAPNGIGGVLATVHEITEKVVGERRVVVLRDLGARVSDAKTAEDACAIAAQTLEAHAADVPFALLYLKEADGTSARLAGAAGVTMGEAISPLMIDFSETGDWPWPLSGAMQQQTAGLVLGLAERFGAVPPGPWPDPPDTAVVMSIPSNTTNEPAGLLVVGVSARLKYDQYYRDFFDLVRTQIATAIANARAYEAERQRAEALAQLARAEAERVAHELEAVRDELAMQVDDLTRLHEFSVRLAMPVDLSKVLEETLATAARILGSDLALLMLHECGRDELQTAASLGSQEEFLDVVGRASPNAGAIGMALAERRRIMIEDVEDDPSFAIYRDAARKAGVRAVYCAPLVTVGGESVGTVACYFPKPHRPSERQMRLVELYARLAAEQIDHARLFQQTVDALQSRDAFLSSAAHDLKTPMTAVKGTAQILRRQAGRQGWRDAERLLHGLADIDAAVTKMAAQIDALQDLARLEMGELLPLRRRSTDLVALARRSVTEQQQTTSRHRIRVESKAPKLVGSWDAPRLTRVLDNLIGNAIKYSPQGGEITLTVHRDERDSEAWAVIVVHDHGLGIPNSDLPHIFERFHRGTNVGGATFGSGIGLVSAKQIVEQHGGTITVESQDRIGSTFIVRLPLAGPEDRPVSDFIEP
ncbi:MAG TPA: ATP-binding protein [Nitrolancea sp.]|nr:ATP-binding protein [Nitrolancea sp.]